MLHYEAYAIMTPYHRHHAGAPRMRAAMRAQQRIAARLRAEMRDILRC